MFIKADPDEPSYIGNLAMAKGPAFQNSSPKCILVRLVFTNPKECFEKNHNSDSKTLHQLHPINLAIMYIAKIKG